MAKSRWFNYSYFSKSPIVAVLDIGSSKICCLIAELDKYKNISIVGAGFQESKGLVSGVITDMSELEKSIRNCVASAEKMASLRVKKVLKLPSNTEINMILGCGIRSPKGIYSEQFRVPFEKVYFKV